jgi:O-acetylserine/cysteine efflux transporter
MKAHLAPRDLALILCAVAIWGFTFVPMTLALVAVPPLALAALRFLFAAIPLVFFVRRPRIPWPLLVGYGGAIGVFQFGLLFLGMKKGMPAGLSSVVIQMQVFFTVGLAAWCLHDRVARTSLLGAGAAALGLIVLAWNALATGASATLAGFALVVGAAFAWAVGNIIAKLAAARGNVDLFALVVWSSLVAPLPLACASYFTEGGGAAFAAAANMSAFTWACVLFMSYFATLFCFGVWNALLHRYPTAVITPFALLIPVSGLLSGALFLSESLVPAQWAGVALVLAGLACHIFGARVRTWRAGAS